MCRGSVWLGVRRVPVACPLGWSFVWGHHMKGSLKPPLPATLHQFVLSRSISCCAYQQRWSHFYPVLWSTCRLRISDSPFTSPCLSCQSWLSVPSGPPGALIHLTHIFLLVFHVPEPFSIPWFPMAPVHSFC